MHLTSESVEALVEQFAKLPTVGRKTAQRLAAYVLKLPREDVVELRRRVDTLEATLDLKADTSWASTTQERVQTLVDALAELVSDVTRLRVGNREEHARLEQEYRAALATVTEDRRFVEHLREIVRFVRTA